MHALRTLLDALVDYAGLFPPAALPMLPAVQRHAAYRAGPARWMLGRFVVPVARLEEFEAAAGGHLPAYEGAAPWRLSALVGADLAGDLARIAAFDARHADGAEAGRATIDALEVKASAPGDLAAIARAVAGRGIDAYVELPAGADAAPYAAAARAHGLRLKLRTGGVTPDAFPAPGAVLAFLVACAGAGVACKLTAGLHHPLRAEYPLTYEPGCARGTMFGFVNVFLCAALLRAGHAPDAVAPLLEERDASAFRWAPDALWWRDRAVDAATVAATRRDGAIAFGSCSFEEPVGDLRALGWWPGDLPPHED